MDMDMRNVRVGERRTREGRRRELRVSVGRTVLCGRPGKVSQNFV